MLSAAQATDWLTAIGGVGAFLATLGLAVLAFFQMRATRQQSRAALEQVTAVREQADAMREVAARQVYPLVYAHEWHGPIWDNDEQAFAMRYYLSNEGLGPALNIEHGVRVGAKEFIFGHRDPYRFRSIQPGEFLPPLDPADPNPVPPGHLTRFVQRNDYYATGVAGPHLRPSEIVYICRYEDLFGDRWETANSNDPTTRVAVRRLPRAERQLADE
jgi:hypothetical protein